MTAELKIESLNYSYDSSSEVFRNLNLQLANSKVLVLGANGSGKSTLLKIIAGIYGSEAVNLSVDVKLSYLGHELQLYSGLSITDNIEFITDVLELEYATKLSETWKLTTLLNKKVSELSAGQKKRLALALYANFESEITLLDEPTVNLDYLGLEIFKNKLKQVSDRLVLIASHDLDYFLPLVDQVLIIDSGNYQTEVISMLDKNSEEMIKGRYLEIVK